MTYFFLIIRVSGVGAGHRASGIVFLTCNGLKKLPDARCPIFLAVSGSHKPPGQEFFAPQAKNYFDFFRQIGQEICNLVSILGKLLKKSNITYINFACSNASTAVFV